jgi:hypothetical protein
MTFHITHNRKRDGWTIFEMFYTLPGMFLCCWIGLTLSKHFPGVWGTLLFYIVAIGGSFANAFCIIWLAGYRRKK